MSILWPNGWSYQDATWYEGIGLGPGHIVLDRDPDPPEKGHSSPHPHFSAHVYIVVKRSPFSATWLNLYPQGSQNEILGLPLIDRYNGVNLVDWIMSHYVIQYKRLQRRR